MSKIAIVTDSVASIPEPMLEELQIHTVPYYIHRGSEVLRDLVTISREKFYQWIPTATEIPKTANPGPGDYLSVYQQIAERGIRKIASIHISSLGSGAYGAALAAKEIMKDKFPDLKIEVIDTLNVSMCQGWMVIEAARAAMSGASLTQVVQRVKDMIPVTRMFQTADTLKYLYMGGRIGRAKHLVASMLDIKPIIGMEEGVIVPLGQARTRKKVYRLMADKLDEAVGESAVKIAYVHAAALEEVDKLRSLVEARVEVVETAIAELSPALGVHTGPGTVGFCFFPDKL